jgi:hypothetical protein
VTEAVLDAHACCALYLAKNEINAFVIFRSIDIRVQDLLASPLPSTPEETLARVQALLLYQIILLFDGDILARAATEATTTALFDAALALMNHITSEPPSISLSTATLPLYPVAAARDFWAFWIFQESARRTVLITFFLLQTSRMLSRQLPLQCDGKAYLCQSWTMSSYLWNARDPLEFALAWKDKKHYVVANADFSEFLDGARGDDLETFGKIFLTALIGIDEAKGWLLTRGGSL